MKIRSYQISDTKEIMALFYNTVHQINIHHYTKEQVDAWAPANMDIQAWMKSLSSKLTYVVEEDDQIIGFGELEKNGHIESLLLSSRFSKERGWYKNYRTY